MDDLHSPSDTTGSVILKYWPIIIAVSATLIALGGIFVKLDYIAKALDRNDAQFQLVNSQQTMTTQSIIEIRGQITQDRSDIARNTQSVAEIRGRLDLLSDKARWAPK